LAASQEGLSSMELVDDDDDVMMTENNNFMKERPPQEDDRYLGVQEIHCLVSL
jgi:hypothetical protein